MKARNPKFIPSSMLKEGDDIFLFYKTTDKPVDVEWITAKITKTTLWNAEELHEAHHYESHTGTSGLYHQTS